MFDSTFVMGMSVCGAVIFLGIMIHRETKRLDKILESKNTSH